MDTSENVKVDERPAYYAERVEFYRRFGYDYAEAGTMASMDANDKYPVKLKSRKIGY